MRGLIEPGLVEDMPEVKAWLAHAEVTRRIIKENYSHLEGQARVTATVEENVLAQIESLRTHPCVRARLARGEVSLYAWVYKIQTGEVFQYTEGSGQFELINDTAPVSAAPETRRRAAI
jgi:carbonic anhydrase